VARNHPQVSRKQNNNKIAPEDRPIHDWYRFVLSYPPHLVREYLEKFGIRPGQRVLDPFCGTGTTLVQCKKLRIPCIGVEANPMAHFASQVKTDWSPDPEGLLDHASRLAESAHTELVRQGIHDAPLPLFDTQVSSDRALVELKILDAKTQALLLTDSISPLPLHKVLVLLEQLGQHHDPRYASHERLALAKALVCSIGNLQFGPEVGVGPPKENAPVITSWLETVRMMAEDLKYIGSGKETNAQVHLADARELTDQLDQNSIDAVITSPPYPNEKDYTRTTRLESVLLGFINSKEDLRHLKRHLVRSNTRGVYKDDDDDVWISDHPEIQRIAQRIENRRISLGKTSGFERLYHRVAKLYFGGMARHLAEMRQILKPGAQLAYVVGDQASYLRVMIRTGELLADIAESLGYEIVGSDLFRTRLATATRSQLREEVLLLRWPLVNSRISQKSRSRRIAPVR